jgi:hypothetical protein
VGHIIHDSEKVFNIWEFDLISQQNALFAGDFLFSGVRGIQYLATDQTLLVGADGPRKNYLYQAKISTSDYADHYNFSETYLIPRHTNILPMPLFTEIYHVFPVNIDQQGDLYLIGGDAKDKKNLIQVNIVMKKH